MLKFHSQQLQEKNIVTNNCHIKLRKLIFNKINSQQTLQIDQGFLILCLIIILNEIELRFSHLINNLNICGLNLNINSNHFFNKIIKKLKKLEKKIKNAFYLKIK